MPEFEKLTLASSLSREKSPHQVWDVFKEWIKFHTVWFVLEGGGGTGKTESKRLFETIGIGLSAGDNFRGANRVFTNLGINQSNIEAIYDELPRISVTTQVIDGEKKIVIQRRNNPPQFFNPDGADDNGLRDPSLNADFTDFLSRDPVAVAWWKQQVRDTLVQAADSKIPVMTEGRTYSHIKKNPEERIYWETLLENSVFGYIYATRKELARRSQMRATKEYPSSKFNKTMTLAEFITFSVENDWERTVKEMTREEEQLARPQEAYRLKDQHIYDFVLNTSELSVAEVVALNAASIMSTLSKNEVNGIMYQAFYEILLGLYKVPEQDPNLNQLEDEIDVTRLDLEQRGKLDT